MYKFILWIYAYDVLSLFLLLIQQVFPFFFGLEISFQVLHAADIRIG